MIPHRWNDQFKRVGILIAILLSLPPRAQATHTECINGKPGEITVKFRVRKTTTEGSCAYFFARAYRPGTPRGVPDLPSVEGMTIPCDASFNEGVLHYNQDLRLEYRTGYDGVCYSPWEITYLTVEPGRHLYYELTFLGEDYCQGFRLKKSSTVLNCEDQEAKPGNAPTRCVPGTVNASLSSVDVRIDLGHDTFDRSAGVLCLSSTAPSSLLTDPSSLIVATVQSTEVLGPNGIPRQIHTSRVLVDTIRRNSTAYQMHFYTNFGGKVSGFYTTNNATPVAVVTIENPGQPPDPNRLRITESRGGTARWWEYDWSADTNHWSFISSEGNRIEERFSAWNTNGTERTDLYLLSDAAHNVVRHRIEKHQMQGGRSNLIERILDPQGAALTNRWRYYDDVPVEQVRYNRLKEVITSSGYWERYDYDITGQTNSIITQFLNAPTNAPLNSCRTVSILRTNVIPQITEVETLLGQEVRRHYRIMSQGRILDIFAQQPGAAWNDPGNLVTTNDYVTLGEFASELSGRRHPAFLAVRASVMSGNGQTNTITTSQGAPSPNGDAVIQGVKRVMQQSINGPVVHEEVRDVATDLLLAESTVLSYDDYGRVIQEVVPQGTNTYSYGCCGLSEIVDVEGVRTTYGYDDQKRIVTFGYAGMTTSNVYDVADQVVAIFRNGMLVNSNAYDAAGQLLSSTDTLTNTTTFVRTHDVDGNQVLTTIQPDGGTIIEKTHPDGEVISVTGTAVHGVRYEYGVSNSFPFTKEIRLNPDGSDTAEWTMRYRDMLGRWFLTECSDGALIQSFFNNRGQLRKQIDPDGVVNLFEYNNLGELIVVATDMDRDDQIDHDGIDRIVRSENEVVAAHGTIVRRTVVTVATIDHSAAVQTNLVADLSGNGFQRWKIVAGTTNYTSIRIDRGNKRRTMTETAADGSAVESTHEDGRLTSVRRLNAEGTEITSRNFVYDAQGRLQRQTDARGGTKTFEYDGIDQPVSVTQSSLQPQSPAQVLRTSYDAMGRPSTLTLPDEGEVQYEYYPTGELKRTFGARTTPVEYEYDHGGRLKSMTTWQDFATQSGAAEVHWEYDPERGWLAAKIFPDNTGLSYTYTPAGRLKTRTQANQLVTQYDYNNAGELVDVDYSDATPDVTLAYDRQGRLASASSTPASCAYSYNATDQVLAEFHDAGPLNGIVISNGYDTVLRRSEMALADSVGSLATTSYGYDTASRLIGMQQASRSVAYAYQTASSLISNLSVSVGGSSVLSTTKAYDDRDRLQSVATAGSQQTLLKSFSYSHNLANQRTGVAHGDGTSWQYAYDSLGNLISGERWGLNGVKLMGQQLQYEYDDVGNRTNARVGSHISNYNPDLLNQYTQRTVPGTIEIIGNASTSATITVNNQPTTRQGSYFHAALSVDNSNAPALTNLDVVGVVNDAGPAGEDLISTSGGVRFLPQTPEAFSYDIKGNVISDGRWNYDWDAEDRLIAMETVSGSIPPQFRQRLEFDYDYQGRRTQKKVYDWDVGSGSWSLVSHLAFIYEGWNLIAEFDAMSSPPELVRSYMWGLDLSGSGQGAGGIGGLIKFTIHNPTETNFFAVYDGSGNVVALVNDQTGAIAANYEYGPFGELLRATGPAASQNPFRFSSKYQDDESGLVYYGHRYYSPTLGRWLSRDPLGEMDSANLYEFADNNPTATIDPTGLAGYFFDGTWNHPYPTNWWDGKRNEKTNVRILYEAYTSKNGNAFYAFGIGSGYFADGTPYPEEGRKLLKNVEGGTGDTMSARVDWMLRKLEDQMRGGDFTVDVYGFSRGGASVVLFLNRIAEKMRKGDPLYCQLKIRFVGIFDAVSALNSFGLSSDFASGRYDGFSFELPRILNYLNQPVHFIALDEQRAQFQSLDLQGADQIGFRGVHSDDGGDGPFNAFSWITLREMVALGKDAGINFNDKVLMSRTYANGTHLFDRQINPNATPTKNSGLLYNDGEQRIFPLDMRIHESANQFNNFPANKLYFGGP